MTEKQKLKIRDMRLDGIGYRRIATELNIPYSSVKSFCKRRGLVGMGPMVSLNNDVAVSLNLVCKRCGARLKHTYGKRKKVFCSDNCRKLYWKENNEVK